jgi:two-component system response regulator AtoC
MSEFPVRISDNPASEETQPRPVAIENTSANAHPSDSLDEPILPLRSVRERVESQAIKSALQRTGWNRKQAARLLKISYRGLLYKIHRHNISPTTEQA